MIFSRLGNIELEKRTSLIVGSSDFISLNPLKTFFLSSRVSEVLIEFNLSHPTLDFSQPCSESAELYVESIEPYVKSAEPYIKSTLSYEESAQPYAKSAEAYAESTQPYVNIYNAACQKIEKTVYDNVNNTIKHVDYLDGFQYAGEKLQFFPTAEGYVSTTQNALSIGNPAPGYIFNYVYNHTDHLGNIRLSYTKDPVSGELKIMEENHYYPFGLKHAVYSGTIKQKYELVENMEETARPGYVYKTDYQYKYNGKKFQDELGLGFYDYGWRNYDPALGRWMNIDPLTEKFYPSTSYAYTVNNPILLNGPDGRDWSITFKKGDDGKWNINITLNAAVVNNSEKKIDIDNYIKEQTAQFERIFSFNNDEFSVSATMNLRAIDNEDDIKGNEHLIAIGDSSKFDGDEGGNADYGGLRVDINSKFINKDGTTSFNHVFSHEVGHTGGLVHPFTNGDKVNFFNGYSYFGLKENRKEASIYNQKLGMDERTNFMSYPQRYFRTNTSTNASDKLKKVLTNPGTVTIGQLGAIFKYYNAGLLNKDNR